MKKSFLEKNVVKLENDISNVNLSMVNFPVDFE